MSISHWVVAVLFGLVAIETLAVVAAHRWADGEPRIGDGVVECPDCGAANRYCRSCVAELPGAPSPRGGFAR